MKCIGNADMSANISRKKHPMVDEFSLSLLISKVNFPLSDHVMTYATAIISPSHRTDLGCLHYSDSLHIFCFKFPTPTVFLGSNVSVHKIVDLGRRRH